MRAFNLLPFVMLGLFATACGTGQNSTASTGDAGSVLEQDSASNMGSGSGGGSNGGGSSGGSSGGGNSASSSSSSSGGANGGSSSSGAGAGDDATAGGGEDASIEASSNGPTDASSSGAVGVGGEAGTPILPGLTPIFDGMTLTGWDGNPAMWSVKDAAIHGLTQNGGQLIKSKGVYDNFRLVGRARIFPPATNHLGVCIWGAPTAAGNWGYSGCVEFTPGSGSYWDYGACGNKSYTYIYATKTVWSVFEILANLTTKKVRVAVNGHEVAPYIDCGKGHQKGPIGLQIHAGASEVEYTDLAIDPAPTADVLLTTAGVSGDP